MILVENTNKVDSTFGVGQRLQIAATATAMKILSKNIYSRPIEAVLRELGTNAADAHVMVGCGDKPFEVALPTYQNMKFVVRDYGPGIAPDKVIPIFATYFSSTKTDDNTVTGCLGLGSKSPLAISDQFIVEIWHGGFYYVWNIYKDEEGYPCVPDGKPSVVLPTTDPTGVQITVPVSEIRGFEDTALSIYKYFNPIPIVMKGQNKVEITPPKVEEQYSSFRTETGSGCYGLMGNIAYPIDSNIAGLEDYRELGYNNKIVIPFEIGELEFSASRESLEYNKRVINTLKSKYKKIISELGVEIQKKCDEKKNPFEAHVWWKNLKLPTKTKSELSKIITFNGVLLNTYYNTYHYTNFDEKVLKKSTAGFTGYVFMHINSYRKSKYEWMQYANMESNTKFYYNDDGTKKGFINRLVALREQTNENMYLFTEDVDIDKWLALNHLTRDVLIPLSSVPKVASNSVYESRKKAGLFTINGGKIQKDFWSPLDEAPDSGYYIPKTGDKMLINGKEIFPDEWNWYKDLGILPTDLPIVGISKSYVKDYVEDEEWTKLEDLMIPALEQKKEEVERALANQYEKIGVLSEFWPQGEFRNLLDNISKYTKKMSTWVDIYNTFGIKLEDKPDLKIKLSDIKKRFPMLKQMFDYYDKPTKAELEQYILDVEKKENCVNVV